MSAQDYRQNFCANIRCLRQQHGLSRSAMARRLGVTVKTLDSIEAGTVPRRCSIRLLFNAERSFGFPAWQLLTCRLENGGV